MEKSLLARTLVALFSSNQVPRENANCLASGNNPLFLDGPGRGGEVTSPPADASAGRRSRSSWWKTSGTCSHRNGPWLPFCLPSGLGSDDGKFEFREEWQRFIGEKQARKITTDGHEWRRLLALGVPCLILSTRPWDSHKEHSYGWAVYQRCWAPWKWEHILKFLIFTESHLELGPSLKMEQPGEKFKKGEDAYISPGQCLSMGWV